jgi:23S rRNA pseudouridine1911/1915/1917 synthase
MKPHALRQTEQHLSEPLSILCEDEHCLALAKPAGQFTQGAWAPEGECTLESAVRRYLAPADPHSVYIGFVHRLDRPTSGVILWAKTEKAARRLSIQFQKRLPLKEYWAIIESDESRLTPIDGPTDIASPREHASREFWHDWLTRADKTGGVSAVDRGTPGARESLTQVSIARAVSLPAGCSWLQLWPQTGRTHQLRIQAARRGTPILGDLAYGARRRLLHPDRIALHARSLSLKHPITGREMILQAPVPPWWIDEGIVVSESEQQATGPI